MSASEEGRRAGMDESRLGVVPYPTLGGRAVPHAWGSCRTPRLGVVPYPPLGDRAVPHARGSCRTPGARRFPLPYPRQVNLAWRLGSGGSNLERMDLQEDLILV